MRLRNTLGESRLTPRKVSRRFLRAAAALWLAVYFATLARFSRRSVTDSGAEALVSLTSHGHRLRQVHLAIESIAQGRMRPNRLILWVDPEDLPRALTHRGIVRLVARGLEVMAGRSEYRAHNKYFNFVTSPDPSYLVTADDDVFYPRDWLAELWATFEAGGRQEVAAYWVRHPRVVGGEFAAFSTWPDATDRKGRRGSFTFGVSGVLLPRQVRRTLAESGADFLRKAPLADDVWISWCALRAGAKVRQCRNTPVIQLVVPHTQSQRLADENVINGQNDHQIAATYDADDRRNLEQLAAIDPGTDREGSP